MHPIYLTDLNIFQRAICRAAKNVAVALFKEGATTWLSPHKTSPSPLKA